MRRFLLLIFILIPYSLIAETVWVFTQAQFDNVVTEINVGKERKVNLSPGTFILKEKIIARNNLTIIGNNSTITWNNDSYSRIEAINETNTHYVCKIKSPINPFSLFVDENDNIINVSESVDSNTLVNTTSQLIIGDNTKKSGIIIKIPISDNLSNLKNKRFSNAYGYFECGWAKVNFILLSSDNKYFNCQTLETTNVPNFNYDINTYKKDIRYVLFNVERKKDCIFYVKDKIFIPKNINRLFCVNCSIYDHPDYSIKTHSNISLKGITFKNFNGISISSRQTDVCNIDNCKFLNTLGCALYLYKDNKNREGLKPATISFCEFFSCSLISSSVVSLDSRYNHTNCIELDNCVISRYPNNIVSYKNCSGIIRIYADAVVTNNLIYNSPRSLLFLSNGNIIVDGNYIFNNEVFNSFYYRNLSNDFGLIYCNHVFSDSGQALKNTTNIIIIQDNLIYGAHGYHSDARGIMIDDGRGDVICRNNVIFDTESYSVDSRDAKGFISTSSIRNIVENNILATKYRLESGSGVPEDAIAISNKNVLLGGFNNVKNKIISKQEDKILSLQYGIYGVDSKAFVSKADYKLLKKLKNWKNVNKFFMVKKRGK